MVNIKNPSKEGFLRGIYYKQFIFRVYLTLTTLTFLDLPVNFLTRLVTN
jgi:hypothetical protein